MSNIASMTISSTPQPTVHFRAAGFFRRFFAMWIDLLILAPFFCCFLILLSFLLKVALPTSKELSPDLFISYLLDPERKKRMLGISFLLLSTLSTLLYQVLFHATKGQTVGEQCLGIAIIDKHGQRPDFLRSLVRAVAGLASFCFAGIGLLWIGFDREKRGFHDLVSGTYSVLFTKIKR